jgi:hypothetical protein
LPIRQWRRQEVLRQVLYLPEEADDLGGWSSCILTPSKLLQKVVCSVVGVQYALSVRWQIFQWASGSPWRDRPNAL